MLLPKKVDVAARPFYLEDSSWLQDVHGAARDRARRFVWDAEGFVVEDPANPQEEVFVAATLLGGMLANKQYFDSKGEKGIALHFAPAIHVLRKVFVSPAFEREKPAIARVFKNAMQHAGCKWKAIESWEQFADLHVATPAARRFTVVAIASDAEAARANEANIFEKNGFLKFVCKMCIAKRGMCGL